jgi:hypothetical protein
VANTNVKLGKVYVTDSSYSTKMCMLAVFDPEDDVETIVASNMSPPKVISPPDTIEFANAVMPAKPHVAIADSGATQIFIMEGTPVNNKRPTDCPLKVALADGR